MDRLPAVLRKMRRALKPGGVMYASFKYGDGPKARGERTFSDFNERTVGPLFEEAGFHILDSKVGNDNRPGREAELWIDVIGRK